MFETSAQLRKTTLRRIPKHSKSSTVPPLSAVQLNIHKFMAPRSVYLGDY